MNLACTYVYLSSVRFSDNYLNIIITFPSDIEFPNYNNIALYPTDIYTK